MLGEPGFVLIALLLVVLSGFSVLAEFAIVKVRARRLEVLVEKGVENAKWRNSSAMSGLSSSLRAPFRSRRS